MEYIHNLLDCDLFDGMDYIMIEQFLHYSNARLQTILRGTVLQLEDFASDNIILVTSGSLKLISKVFSADTDFVVEHILQGGVFGMALSILGQTIPGYVRATTNTNFLLIPGTYIKSGCSASFPYYQLINRNIIRMLANRVQINALRVDYFRYPTLKKRLSAYLCNHAPEEDGVSFTLPLNKGLLAEFLGVSRPTLVRLLSTMQDEGIIQYHLNSYTLLNRSVLEENLL